MRIIRTNLATGIVAATGAILFGQPALAQSDGGVAVSAEGFGGIARDQRPLNGNDGEFSGGVLPSVGFGLGGVATIQIDGMVASHLKDTVFAGAGHLGIKASGSFSIGAYGAYTHFDSAPKLDTYRIGGEAVYHAERVSVTVVAGYEHSEKATVVAGAIPGFTVVDRYGRSGSFFSMADVSFYPSDNWSLTAGHRYIGGRHAAALGTEKAFAGSGLSLFAEGRIGAEGYAAAWTGIRIKFGRHGPSLQASDRSGYVNRLKDELFVPANTRSRTLVAPPAPPTPPPGGTGSCCGACYT
ncbi:MAG: hypothetical protein ABI240_09565 [Sphingomonas sp.]